MKILIFLVAALILCPLFLSAEIISVPWDQPTIQAGIDAASEGDTVMVAGGAYSGPGNNNIEFRGKGLLLTTDGNPIGVTIECSVDSLSRGFYVHEGEDQATIIDGFEIINGMPILPGGSGGGMRCDGTSPTVRNCTFSACGGYNGGAVACNDGAAPRFENCEFYNNSARYGGAVGGHSTFEIIEFVNCVFVENYGEFGSAVYGFALTFTNCTFYGNVGEEMHGTIEFYAGGVVMNNCLVAFNDNACAVFNGDSSEAYLTCCDIYGNEGGDYVYVLMGQQYSNGNFWADPIFCAPYINDISLAFNSPCLPANNDCDVLIGAYGQGCETGVVCGDINGDGLVNILDINAMIECIYMGIGCPDPIILGDVNNDDAFNILDVTYLISYLYADGPPPMC